MMLPTIQNNEEPDTIATKGLDCDITFMINIGINIESTIPMGVMAADIDDNLS